MTRKLLPGRRSLAVLAAGFLTAGIAACSSSGGTGKSATSGGSVAALTMESSPENSISDNFNPFATTQAMYGMGPTGLVYEPLIQFNLANPTVQYPWLATKFAWGKGGKSITFTIRPGVKWNDGQPLTAKDVAFTFNLVKKYPDINIDGLKISSVSSSGDTVTVNFPAPQYMELEFIAGQAILPEHIWSTVGDPGKFTDPKPVGTGPYVLSSFNSQGVTMAANPSYWQPVPVKKVYFPVYADNQGALTALYTNKIDWTGNFIPGLQQDFVSKDPSHHHFWEAAGSSNALIPNLQSGHATADPAVRKAISAAIDRSLVASQAVAGLEAPLTNATGLTLPTYQAWAAPVSNLTQSPSADVAKAKQILQADGWKQDASGIFAKGGKELKVTIMDPASYSDYAAADQLINQQLKAAGIASTFDGSTVDAWTQAVSAGTFDLTIHWSNGGITPYPLYQNWLDDTLLSGPTGASGDYERLKDPKVQTMLQKLNSDATVAQQAADLAPIEKYVADNLPVIPTTTAAQWFEYNSQHYIGWPTQANPYETGQPSGTNNGPGTGTDEVVLLHLKPVS